MNELALTAEAADPTLVQIDMKNKQLITVPEVAKRLRKATTTIYGMIARGELSAFDNGDGVRVLSSDVRGIPKRGPGHPLSKDPNSLRGKVYAKKFDSGMTIGKIAEEFAVSKQAVSQAILRYREAAVREG